MENIERPVRLWRPTLKELRKYHRRKAIRIWDGYIRCYGDHTGRWWDQYPRWVWKWMKKVQDHDPLVMILREEIQKEVDREIIARLVEAINATRNDDFDEHVQEWDRDCLRYCRSQDVVAKEID